MENKNVKIKAEMHLPQKKKAEKKCFTSAMNEKQKEKENMYSYHWKC